MEGDENAHKDVVATVPFLKNTPNPFASLSFGDGVAGQDAADWIGGVGYPHVRYEINHNTQVWVYRNRAGQAVGFGSLGRVGWELDGRRQTVQFIPMLAVAEPYQGLPTSDSGSSKYCRQVIDHLLDEAEKRIATSRFLGLSVRLGNGKAIRLYEAANFEWLVRDEKRGVGRMLLDLL